MVRTGQEDGMFVREVREPARVASIEGIMDGTPCVVGTRVPAEVIVVHLRSGCPDLEIFRHYPSLPHDGIDAVRTWARENGVDIGEAERTRARA
jgi:uncharacterized protein (DUF433 family)